MAKQNTEIAFQSALYQLRLYATSKIIIGTRYFWLVKFKKGSKTPWNFKQNVYVKYNFQHQTYLLENFQLFCFSDFAPVPWTADCFHCFLLINST